jgi:hypothetical protein
VLGESVDLRAGLGAERQQSRFAGIAERAVHVVRPQDRVDAVLEEEPQRHHEITPPKSETQQMKA